MIEEFKWDGINLNEITDFLNEYNLIVYKYHTYYESDMLCIKDFHENQYLIKKGMSIKFYVDENLNFIPYFLYLSEDQILYFDVSDRSKLELTIHQID